MSRVWRKNFLPPRAFPRDPALSILSEAKGAGIPEREKLRRTPDRIVHLERSERGGPAILTLFLPSPLHGGGQVVAFGAGPVPDPQRRTKGPRSPMRFLILHPPPGGVGVGALLSLPEASLNFAPSLGRGRGGGPSLTNRMAFHLLSSSM